MDPINPVRWFARGLRAAVETAVQERALGARQGLHARHPRSHSRRGVGCLLRESGAGGGRHLVMGLCMLKFSSSQLAQPTSDSRPRAGSLEYSRLLISKTPGA